MLKIANTFSIINMMAAARMLSTGANGSANKVKMTADYLQFASTFDKNYTTESDFKDHQTNYEASEDYIRRCNEKADASGDPEAVHCGHNKFSDWSDEEFKHFVSGIQPIDESEIEMQTAPKSGMLLGDLPKKVNHKKWMGPVKSQGNCGSCAAFAATSTLEGSIAKKMRKKNTQHISEQHLLDCTMDTEKTRELFGDRKEYNWGCNGGYMHTHWEFQKDHGAMTIEDYPYNATEGECVHDVDDIYGYVSSYKKYYGSKDLGTMMEEVSKQPVSMVLYASSKNFRYYKSGILKNCCDKDLDPDCEDMDLSVNHAVTVTGYKVKKRKNGKQKGFWRVQNSWGSGWGKDGFIKVDLFGEGDGVCNINRYGVWSVDFDLQTVEE